jgi:hypothetical protein
VVLAETSIFEYERRPGAHSPYAFESSESGRLLPKTGEFVRQVEAIPPQSNLRMSQEAERSRCDEKPLPVEEVGE